MPALKQYRGEQCRDPNGVQQNHNRCVGLGAKQKGAAVAKGGRWSSLVSDSKSAEVGRHRCCCCHLASFVTMMLIVVLVSS